VGIEKWTGPCPPRTQKRKRGDPSKIKEYAITSRETSTGKGRRHENKKEKVFAGKEPSGKRKRSKRLSAWKVGTQARQEGAGLQKEKEDGGRSRPPENHG